jgi:pimeloyl-ACP methyl ester carboxylesterase
MIIPTAKFLVHFLPESLAIHVMRALATRTQRPPVTLLQQQAMAHASKIHYGQNNMNVAWVWGEGPLVVLAHGWNGRAAQMAPLAESITKLGFQCVAIEVTGHGSSPGKQTKWACFIDDITALSRSLGREIHAYIGHSAGGLAMMAARRMTNIHAKLYVCICAPSHPFPPINIIRQKLNPSPALMDRYRQYIATQFGTDWDDLQSGYSYAGAGSDLLLFYDEGDRFVNHEEGDQIQGWCEGAQLVKSKSYGHTKVLAAPEMLHAVGTFLCGGGASRELSAPHCLENANVAGGMG